jgi:hypothetical protein
MVHASVRIEEPNSHPAIFNEKTFNVKKQGYLRWMVQRVGLHVLPSSTRF